MTIEVLYPEIANLYGDNYNIKYLQDCNKKIKIINTSLTDEPYFVKNKVNMIYLGPMPDKYQEMVIEKLRPYISKIKKMIESGIIFLATGNALEIFGSCIQDKDKEIAALDIFPIKVIRDFEHRHNSLFLGQYEDIKIVGYKSQFSSSFNNVNPFIKLTKGNGLNNEDKFEGLHYQNFFGTYLLGPLLILNPLFTKKILQLLKSDDNLAYEAEIIAAYEYRLKEYEDEKTHFTSSH